jgi:universal stress protein E
MRSIRRILVAVKDPLAPSFPAVLKAAQLAQGLDAEIELFHAIATPMYLDVYGPSSVPLSALERDICSQSLKRLETLARRVRHNGIKVAVAAEWDFPGYEAIVRRARLIKADLIVAAQHAGRHIAAGLLHLTDWELLRQSPLPVLLVKAGRQYRRPVVLAAVDPSQAHSKPAGLDEQILRAGATVAHALDGTLHALHAYFSMSNNVTPLGGVSPDAVVRQDAEAAAAANAAFHRVLRRTKISKANRHLVGRHPINAIEQTARELHSSIVVMGAISRSGLKRLLIGNTAEGVLGRLDCDILIVKPLQFASRVSRQRQGIRLVTVTATP